MRLLGPRITVAPRSVGQGRCRGPLRQTGQKKPPGPECGCQKPLE